jgi:tetratricopeptide (TPR) repeat protein
MSALSNIAMELLSKGQLREAGPVAKQAVREQPGDWHARYVLGRCLQDSNDLAGAVGELLEANRLSHGNPSILLALGIAKQLSGDCEGALNALRQALEIDPEFIPAINSLAMTQKLMGNFSDADKNYVIALRVLSKVIVKDWRNSVDNVRMAHWESRNHLWVKYATHAALWLAAEADMDSIAMPTGETAVRDAQTAFLKGWYWNDGLDRNGKKVRSFYPNFFNTFRSDLAKGGIYRHLIGNRGTVLERLGKAQEAEAHLQEAVDFSS